MNGALAMQCEKIIPGASVLRWDYLTHLSRYIFALPYCTGQKRVLEAGCGAGYGSSLLASESSEVTAMDIEEKALRIARTNFRKPNLEFCQANVEELPFGSENFDTVISFGVLDHLENPNKAVAEFARVLKPGGTVIVSLLNREFITAPLYHKVFGHPIDRTHRKEFNCPELADLVGLHFDNLTLYGQAHRQKQFWRLKMVVGRLCGRSRTRRARLLKAIMKPILPSSYSTIIYSEDKVLVDTDLRNNLKQVANTEEGNRLVLMLITARKRKS